MEFQFLGTGNARQVPCYGCECLACSRARTIKDYRRGPCSAMIKTRQGIVLLDAGQVDLTERFPPQNLLAIVLTHYHMDHVQGLFHLRWGKNHTIPVYGPKDDQGCDDLFKHPGILHFMPPPSLFQAFQLGELFITPLTLNHSKPCVGYLIKSGDVTIAYLTDTLGLPEVTFQFLNKISINYLIVDCSSPPKENPQNHNSLTEALDIIESLQPDSAYLTHIGHDLDSFFITSGYQLPENVFLAKDNQRIMTEDLIVDNHYENYK